MSVPSLQGEIPDIGTEELGHVILPSAHSYSPHKEERAALLDYEVNEQTLPDTVRPAAPNTVGSGVLLGVANVCNVQTTF